MLSLGWDGMDRQAKFAALLKGWLQVVKEPPTSDEVSLAGAVAEHETRCGDAWPGEYNWGGLQLAKLSDEEKAKLQNAGIEATAPYMPEGVVALREASALLSRPDGAIHCDSTPGPPRRWYFVWFHRFANDDVGAAFFVKRLLSYEGVRAALATGSSQAVAEAMYRGRYFEGFHDPTPQADEKFSGVWPRKGWMRQGPLTAGEKQNVDDYALALAGFARLWRGIANVELCDTLDEAKSAPMTQKTDIRHNEGVRERVARIASEHAPMDVATKLKELGAFLSAGLEVDDVKLAKTPTSCGTFARACLLWSGCDNPLLVRPYEIASAITRLCELAGMWTDQHAWRKCTGPIGPQPEVGDVFRICTTGQNDDHVGVILEKLGSWTYKTAEGGQAPSGCDVGSFVRKFTTHGNAMFLGARQLQGWIDCTAIGLPESPVTKAIQPDVVKTEVVREDTDSRAKPFVALTGAAIAASTIGYRWMPWWFILGVIACAIFLAAWAVLRRR